MVHTMNPSLGALCLSCVNENMNRIGQLIWCSVSRIGYKSLAGTQFQAFQLSDRTLDTSDRDLFDVE